MARVPYADENGIDMPVIKTVDAILHHGQSVDAAVGNLLSRALRDESE